MNSSLPFEMANSLQKCLKTLLESLQLQAVARPPLHSIVSSILHRRLICKRVTRTFISTLG